jgi:SOS-response transcriptional repressor LexA
MSEIAENIKKLMGLEGISPAELSAKTGIERSTLHRILDGSTKNPTIESIKTIIKHYSFDEVVFGINASEKYKKNEVPVINWSAVCSYCISEKEYSNKKTFKVNIPISENSFAIVMEETLDVRFQKNSILIVDCLRAPKNRSYIFVKEYGSFLPLIKRYILEGNTAYLKPMDPSLPTTKYEPEKFKIIGVIVQSIMDFEE